MIMSERTQDDDDYKVQWSLFSRSSQKAANNHKLMQWQKMHTTMLHYANRTYVNAVDRRHGTQLHNTAIIREKKKNTEGCNKNLLNGWRKMTCLTWSTRTWISKFKRTWDLRDQHSGRSISRRTWRKEIATKEKPKRTKKQHVIMQKRPISVFTAIIHRAPKTSGPSAGPPKISRCFPSFCDNFRFFLLLPVMTTWNSGPFQKGDITKHPFPDDAFMWNPGGHRSKPSDEKQKTQQEAANQSVTESDA